MPPIDPQIVGPSSIQPACLVVDPKDATQEIEGSSFFQGCHPGFPGGNTTVDGSEIRETHQLSSLSHYLQGFRHPRWCRISSINSMCKATVFGRNLLELCHLQTRLPDFFHQDWRLQVPTSPCTSCYFGKRV